MKQTNKQTHTHAITLTHTHTDKYTHENTHTQANSEEQMTAADSEDGDEDGNLKYIPFKKHVPIEKRK